MTVATPPVPTPAPRPERKVLGISVGDVMKILLGASIAWTATYFNRQSPYVRFTVSEVVSFAGDENKLGMFT
ncbi:MAG TPA: hypothetical protein VM165_17940, partial [Planctomycetaceae bacterium]|nr:hypothetical protein [Planctomycetaceae bacterium]